MLAIQRALDSETDASLLDLVGVIERLAGARTMQEVAAIVRTAARQICGADGVTFVLRDADNCWYVDEDAIGPLWKGQRFPMQSCVSGWAMLHRRTAVIPDIYADPRVPHVAYRPTFVKSMIMTPVRVDDPVAAIGAYWATVGAPEQRAIDRLEAVARAAATALANVQLIASLEQAVEHRDFLIRELDHRVKNTLTAVLAISNRTLRAATSPEAFAKTFKDRIFSLSKAHEHLAERRWRDAEMRDLVLLALAPFRGAHDEGVVVDGPSVQLRPEAAVSFLMTCHELATNAAKYGALSVTGGRVTVAWALSDNPAPGALVFDWVESDGPSVVSPERRGFGFDMIQRGFVRDVGGEARLDFAPEGVRFHLTAPLSQKIIFL